MRMIALLTAVLVVISLTGCTHGQEFVPKAEPSIPEIKEAPPSKTEKKSEAPSAEFKIDPTVEKYDRIFSSDMVQFLIREEQEEPGFTEEQISYFTMSKAIPPLGYDFVVGTTKEEFDETALKYLGKTVTDYNNRAIKTLENGNILPTGWSPSPYHFVLKSLEELDNCNQKAVCYQVFHDFEGEESRCNQALSGDFHSWEQVFLVEISFIPKNNENGEEYLQYVDVVSVGEAEEPYTIFQKE